jgi:hypothetical protein
MSIISIGIPIPDRSALPGQTGSGEEVNLQYTTQNYCGDHIPNPVSPSVATPTGGSYTFSVTSGGPTLGLVPGDGTVNIQTSDPGSYVVTYTVPGVGSANFPINITAVQDSSFSYSASAFCENASNQTPTITTPGGSFTTQDLGAIPHKLQFAVTSGGQKTISLRVSSSPLQYTIDWGDGSPVLNNYTSNAPSHTYNDGTYNDVTNPIVSINALGDVSPATAVNFAQAGSYQDLIDIVQWGTAAWTSMYRAYFGCSLGNVSATDIPNLSLGPNMDRMFTSSSIGTANFNNWDISNVSVISQMFRDTPNYRGNMSNWNFVNNNNISLSFFIASGSGVYDGEAGNWNVSGVSLFNDCFRYQTNWDCNLADWYVNGFNPNLISMYRMFRDNGISSEQYTDSIVGWAVAVKRDGAPYNVPGPSQTPLTTTFLTSRTQNTDNNGVTVDYSTKYGADWDSNWSDAGNARQFLLDNGWTIA